MGIIYISRIILLSTLFLLVNQTGAIIHDTFLLGCKTNISLGHLVEYLSHLKALKEELKFENYFDTLSNKNAITFVDFEHVITIYLLKVDVGQICLDVKDYVLISINAK